MNYEERYKKRIDEIEEYMEYVATMFDEIQTPQHNTIDVIQTPEKNSIDEIKTPASNSLDEIKTPSNYDTELKVTKRDSVSLAEEKVIDTNKLKVIEKEVEDWLEDYLLYAYAMGTDTAGEMLGSDFEPNESLMAETINNNNSGWVVWRALIKEHLDKGDVGLCKTVALTEFHRVYDTAIMNAGIEHGATRKTWKTMQDEKVRDSHTYLDGVSVGINEDFYTWDGSHAPHPGAFGVAEEDCNCRCYIKLD